MFYCDRTAVTNTKVHVVEHEVRAGEHAAHREDTGPLSEANGLTRGDSKQLTIAQETLRVPRTLRRRDAALALEWVTLPPMLREAP